MSRLVAGRILRNSFSGAGMCLGGLVSLSTTHAALVKHGAGTRNASLFHVMPFHETTEV